MPPTRLVWAWGFCGGSCPYMLSCMIGYVTRWVDTCLLSYRNEWSTMPCKLTALIIVLWSLIITRPKVDTLLIHPKLQRYKHWSLWKYKQFHLGLFNGYKYLSMLELKSNHDNDKPDGVQHVEAGANKDTKHCSQVGHCVSLSIRRVLFCFVFL